MTDGAIRKTMLAAGLGLALLAGSAAMIWGFGKSGRPSLLNLSVQSHGATPAVMRVTINGRLMLEQSIKGRNESGPADYLGSDDGLNFDVAWYDILADRSYALTFAVPASELSTYDAARDNADIAVLIGPGADVTVTTPNRAALLLVGENKLDQITPEMDADVVLRALCAAPLPAEDATAQALAAGVEDWSLAQAMDIHDRTLAEQGAPTPRCPATEG